jgi:hypothetical protein
VESVCSAVCTESLHKQIRFVFKGLTLLHNKLDKKLWHTDNIWNDYDDDDDDDNNTTHPLKFTYWFLFTYLFLILHSLSPHSLITNLHIFLSLSYSFLLVAAWRLLYSYRCFLALWESQNFRTHWQKCRYFHDSEKPRIFDIPNWILWDSRAKLFKTHKTGTNPEKPGQMRSLTLHCVVTWDSSWYYILSTAFS